MKPEGVTQEPEPPSSSNRNRVLHLEHTNRSHGVHHEPGLHKVALQNLAASPRPGGGLTVIPLATDEPEPLAP